MADAYLFGHISTGIILRTADPYPHADGYAEVVETLENHCGEATGSALVLARLGAAVVLEGNWIGDNPQCRRTLEFLAARGIDTSGLIVEPGYEGVTEVVVSDGESRTVFGPYKRLLFTERQWEMPRLDRVRRASVVCVDPSFGEATLAVARTAHEAGVPLVTSDAPPEDELARLAAVVVVSREALRWLCPEAKADEAARAAFFRRYVEACPGLIVFTAGAGPIWYARGGKQERHELRPFKIDVVDSAGAGDAFRGGIIHGVLHGWDDARMIRFGSAVAALVCTTAPGCVNPPTLEQVEALLRTGEVEA